MSSSMDHSKIIAQVAKETLTPLGIFQEGRSRTWIDDRGWWIVVIEFQPSGSSKGSYLNVGAMWLWREKDYFTFDVGVGDTGGRVAKFVEYVDEEQFRPEIVRLASAAKAEALKLRSKFASIRDAARYLPGQARREPLDRIGRRDCSGIRRKDLQGAMALQKDRTPKTSPGMGTLGTGNGPAVR
jgi:hypothetical protein